MLSNIEIECPHCKVAMYHNRDWQRTISLIHCYNCNTDFKSVVTLKIVGVAKEGGVEEAIKNLKHKEDLKSIGVYNTGI